MAKLPTDLSPKWWSDHKPMTMKATGFGKALKTYEDAVGPFNAATRRTPASIAALQQACKELANSCEAAKKFCKPLIHDDAKESLKKYDALIAKEGDRINAIADACAKELVRLKKLVKAKLTNLASSYKAKHAKDEAKLAKMEEAYNKCVAIADQKKRMSKSFELTDIADKLVIEVHPACSLMASVEYAINKERDESPFDFPEFESTTEWKGLQKINNELKPLSNEHWHRAGSLKSRLFGMRITYPNKDKSAS